MLVEIAADDGRPASCGSSSTGPRIPSASTWRWTRSGAPVLSSKFPERPGLGLEVDRALLERYAVTTGASKR